MKKIAIIYVSIHRGNTKKIVDVMKEALDADIYSVTEARTVDFSDYDLLGIASGIYMEDVGKAIYQFIERKENLPKNVFCVTTSAVLFMKYGKRFSKKLERLGFHVLDYFECKGYSCYGILKYIDGMAKGHPDVEDVNKAREFCKKILHQ